jgi:ribosomal protein S18 acetylase RimI-like enzyme
MQKQTQTSISFANLADFAGIKSLYQTVAKIEGGLARNFIEITDDYISHNLQTSIERGICFLAKVDDTIVAEIHAYRPFPSIFSHVLSDLTIAVHPDYQALGIGRLVFNALLNEVVSRHPEILRVELFTRASNHRAIRFYQSLGFHIEGEFKARVRTPEGDFEADLAMAWIRTGNEQ